MNEKNRQTFFPLLEMVAGPEEGRRIALPEGAQVVGRTKEVPIYLDDTSVSRNHALLERMGSTITIRDLKSRNGIYLNGQKLQPDEERTLSHCDEVRVGIYTFRVLFQEMSAEELKSLERAPASKSSPSNSLDSHPQSTEGLNLSTGSQEALASLQQEIKDSVKTDLGQIVVDSSSTKLDEEFQKELEEGSEKVSIDAPAFDSPGRFGVEKKMRTLFWTIAVLLVAATMIFFFYTRDKRLPDQGDEAQQQDASQLGFDVEAGDGVQPEKPHPDSQTDGNDTSNIKVEKGVEGLASSTTPAADSNTPSGPTNEDGNKLPDYTVVTSGDAPENKSSIKLPVFLDVTSEPLSARIFLEGKDLGTTPLKVSVPLVPGKNYELLADFELRDVRDHFQEKIIFKADLKKEVLPIQIKAQLATIKVTSLPRNIGFSLQGYYAYDKHKTSPVNIKDIVYGKPVYLPYGSYSIELRERTRVGDSSTFVDQIRYHRDLILNAERSLVELSLNERDLQFFPAVIRSSPSGANLFIDGEKVGVTPFQGDLPLGQHEIKLTRDGYFDYVSPLDMRTNTPYESFVELRTSKVGSLINKAKELKNAGQFQLIVDTLVEALRMDSSEREKTEIHYLLGDAFYQMKNREQALVYFDQAKSHPDFYYRALLGTARILQEQGDVNRCLTILVEVLLNTPKDLAVKNEAQALFTKVSPLKSVLYLRTEPAGASVFVNSMPVSQKTPLILSDLALGNYRLEVQLSGYKSETIKQNLKISEFVPIDIKLKPEQL